MLADLARQQGISFEVIIADGGSIDTTCQLANDLFVSDRLSGSCHVGPSVRGQQLNAGVAVANSDWLLFLHADSRLVDVNQLLNALGFIHAHQKKQTSDASAGRFSLLFDISSSEKSFGLFYYEAKARLDRSGCIHGDQGMLMTKSFFHRVGPFREDLPVMEDTSIAETIRATGQWLLLPGKIVTSARRFQVEGLKSRQTLNALMMNFMSIGWLEFFAKAPEIYCQQDRTQPLQLFPFFHLIKKLLHDMPLRKRWRIWLATGGYVRSQAWQIGLALDCRKAYRQGLEPGCQNKDWLNWFDRWFNPLTNHWFGRTVTALLVRIWFAWQFRCEPDTYTNRK